LPRVDAEAAGTVPRRRPPGRRAKKNVPSPPRTTRASVDGSSRTSGRRIARTGFCHSPMPRDPGTKPEGGGGRSNSTARLDRRVCRRKPIRLNGHPPVTSAIGPRSSAQTRAGREIEPGKFAVAFRTRDRRGDDRARVAQDRGRRRFFDGAGPGTSRWTAGDRERRRGPVRAAAGLELRLHQGRRCGARSRAESVAGDRPQDLVERDERGRR